MVEAVIFLGAIAGGFVSGLTGFGTGLTVLAFWLLVIPPLIASPLVIICSLIAQLQTFVLIWHAIRWNKVLPYLLGGIIGVPIGYKILQEISVEQFKLLFGILLVFYCGFTIIRPRPSGISSFATWLNPVVGIAGGVLGGLAGLSGVPPSIWATMQNWGKDEMRAIFQTFNLSILLIALITQLFRNNISTEVLHLSLIALPGTIIGAWAGRKIYSRLNDQKYRTAILYLLMFSGLSLILSVAI